MRNVSSEEERERTNHRTRLRYLIHSQFRRIAKTQIWGTRRTLFELQQKIETHIHTTERKKKPTKIIESSETRLLKVKTYTLQSYDVMFTVPKVRFLKPGKSSSSTATLVIQLNREILLFCSIFQILFFPSHSFRCTANPIYFLYFSWFWNSISLLKATKRIFHSISTEYQCFSRQFNPLNRVFEHDSVGVG